MPVPSTPPTLSPPPLTQPPRPMAAGQPAAPVKATLPAGYLVAWVMLAVASISYISLVTFWPGASSRSLAPDVRTSEPETNEGARAKAMADVRALQQDLSAARLNIAKLETEIRNRDEQARRRALSEHSENKATEDVASNKLASETAKADAAESRLAEAVAKVEPTIAPPSAPAPSTPSAAAASVPVEIPLRGAELSANTAAAAAPGISTSVINAPTAAPSAAESAVPPVETGAITPAAVASPVPAAPEPAAKKPPVRKARVVIPPPPVRAPSVPAVRAVEVEKIIAEAKRNSPAPTAPAQPVAFSNAVVTPAEPALAVELGTGASVTSLRLTWSALLERHQATLGGLQPRYVAGRIVGTAPQTFNLVAGPVRTSLEAQKICQVMRGNGLPCAISIFTGSAL